MKAILEFSLPEEQTAHRDAINGGVYIAALQEIDNLLRNDLKYNEQLSDDIKDKIQSIRDSVNSICNGFNINIWE